PGCDTTRLQDDRARLRFTGTFEAIKELKAEPQMSYRGVASATGMAVYDVKYKRMTSLLLYFHGTSESGPKATGEPGLGAVIEWQWERASPRCNDSPERRVVRAGTLQARCPLQLLLRESVMNKITLVALLGFAWSTQALANGLEVTESGKPPARKALSS